MNIEEKIKDWKNNIDGGYIDFDTNDIIDIIEFIEDSLSLTKHYSDKNNWLSTIGSHIDDWYDYRGHNGYDAAKQLLEKYNIK